MPTMACSAKYPKVLGGIALKIINNETFLSARFFHKCSILLKEKMSWDLFYIYIA
jgi:hypothetical protein